MKLSYKALLEWVDLPASASDLADLLSGLGFPNDGITHLGEGLDQVLIGKVLTKTKHPEADRLNLLNVNIGRETLPIVCGANNMEVGDYVALAPVGATVPGRDGLGMTMREAKIRGHISKGMCCSEVELRLAEASEGILLLPKSEALDQQLGQKVSSVFDWEDWILEIDVTPNRSDALSIRGIARQMAAKLGLKLKWPATYKWKNPSGAVNPAIESFEDAPGFAACLVSGVSFQSTPKPWKNFLTKMGARSISNLVDITNIVLFELGHPIHFFDADRVDLASIGVRRAKAGEKLELLNSTSIDLHPDDLVIADSTGPLSLAGIMGGQRTAVSDSTRNILIEAASFRSDLIRASSRRHGLQSESSYRFERGISAFRLDEVIERTLGLLKELSGFDSASGTKTIDRHLASPSVLWDRTRVESKLGSLGKTDDELFEMMRRLEYSFEPRGSSVEIKFPWYRTDAGRLEMVMEDLARLIGYDQLERKPLLARESVSVLKDLNPLVALSENLLTEFRTKGFSEVVELSFTSDQGIEVENPIFGDKPFLKEHLLPGLLNRARENAFHYEDEIRLMELGPVFSRNASEGLYDDAPICEQLSMACVWLVRPHDKKFLWSNSADAFFEFKGILESLLRSLPLTSQEAPTYLHPNRRFLVGGVWAGELHPKVQASFDLPSRALVAEWRLQARPFHQPNFGKPQDYPPIDLDASFVLDRSLRSEDILKAFKKADAAFLESVRLYDLFESKELKEKKSMAFAMRYRSADKTLTLDEAKKSHEALIKSALESFPAGQIALR